MSWYSDVIGRYNQRAGLILAPLVILSASIYGASISLTNESTYATSEQNSTSIQGQGNGMVTANNTSPQNTSSTSNNASTTSRSFRITF